MALIPRQWAKKWFETFELGSFFQRYLPQPPLTVAAIRRASDRCDALEYSRIQSEGISGDDPIDLEEESLNFVDCDDVEWVDHVARRPNPGCSPPRSVVEIGATFTVFASGCGVNFSGFQPNLDIAHGSRETFESQVRAGAKAYALLLDVLGQKQYKQFLRDGYLEIEGEYGSFVLTVGGRIYRIEGDYALSLCIGPDENCPVMDKICSLYLMIKEDEEAVIKEANVISETPKNDLFKLIKEGV